MIIGITGGTSGLGKRLTEYLINKGYKVRVLVRETSQVDDLIKWGAELVYGDISDFNSLVTFIKDIDICYHLAAQVNMTAKGPSTNVNIEGTRNICEAILQYNLNCRLIYCSSFIVTEIRFYNKFLQSSYAISKYKAEKIIDKYAKKYQLKSTVIYPGYIYGPYDRNFMPIALKILRHGLKFVIRGGEKNAPVIYTDDLCELFLLAGIKDIALGKKYVSVKRSEIGLHGFLKIIADKMNYSFPQKVYPRLPLLLIAFVLVKVHKIFRLSSSPKIDMRLIEGLSFNPKYFNDDAVRELGWDQRVSIQEGISKALEWQINNNR
jgi:Nucleoside-diphosphate-sugar epimerases